MKSCGIHEEDSSLSLRMNPGQMVDVSGMRSDKMSQARDVDTKGDILKETFSRVTSNLTQ
jgi:hypothetical protein